MNKKEFFKQRIDKIAKESFNADQKDIAKKIIDNADEKDLDAVWGLISQRVKIGFVFDEAPEINHNSIAYIKENQKLGVNLENQEALEHTLIIGENYDALKNLVAMYTDKQGKGLIDVIYIDPPYNTDKSKEEGNDYKEDIEGKNKFIYRDKYTRDGWLNMMNERLKLAKKLLSDRGIIFISIDDNEQAYLTILCDEIFKEENFIANSFVLDNIKGKSNDNFITSVGSRLLCYAKNKSLCEEIGFNKLENIFGEKVENTYKYNDEIGPFKLISFRKTGQSKLREDRPLMFYPILEKDGVLSTITEEEFKKLYDAKSKTFNDKFLKDLIKKYHDFNVILPKDKNGEYLRWTSGFQYFCANLNTNIIFDGSVKQKKRPSAQEFLQEFASGTPKNFMYKPSYANGTADLETIIHKSGFDFPKPVTLIKDLLKLTDSKNSVVLDFFAGSGTTGQAIMELNEEDGGNRKFILVTNNENNIAINITRERLYRVIKGKGSKGEKFKWRYSKDKKNLPNNSLRVFDIVKEELNITEIDKAEKIKDEVEKNFVKLKPDYTKNSNLNIYNVLASLTPYKDNSEE